MDDPSATRPLRNSPACSVPDCFSALPCRPGTEISIRTHTTSGVTSKKIMFFFITDAGATRKVTLKQGLVSIPTQSRGPVPCQHLATVDSERFAMRPHVHITARSLFSPAPAVNESAGGGKSCTPSIVRRSRDILRSASSLRGRRRGQVGPDVVVRPRLDGFGVCLGEDTHERVQR